MSLSPRTASVLASYTSTSLIHQSWECALLDVLGVLKIQYRGDDDVMLFLSDTNKLKRLQCSTAAKMEWNRRVIKEEMDSGIHSPPRARRIAKEVAIDYIRRFIDGEEERLGIHLETTFYTPASQMLKRIQALQQEKDDTLTTLIEYERQMVKYKEEAAKLEDANERLRQENKVLAGDKDEIRRDGLVIKSESEQSREENDNLRLENGKLREENKKLRQENQDLRNENGALRSENQKVRLENQKLRSECEDVRGENIKVRTENQSLRDENQEVRCENLKLREDNNSFREDNERLRGMNGSLSSDNRKLIQDNMEHNAREDEMRMLVNVLQSLLAGKTGASREVMQAGKDLDDCNSGGDSL